MEDLDSMLRITDEACGKTICVLAEAWSWPATSYLEKFRSEFETYINKRSSPLGGRLYEPLSPKAQEPGRKA